MRLTYLFQTVGVLARVKMKHLPGNLTERFFPPGVPPRVHRTGCMFYEGGGGYIYGHQAPRRTQFFRDFNARHYQVNTHGLQLDRTETEVKI
jgi:hypothetical protein